MDNRSTQSRFSKLLSPYFIILIVVLLVPVMGFHASSDSAHQGAHHDSIDSWSYEGIYSPEKWGDLKLDYALCKYGRKQSPVDFPIAKNEAQSEAHTNNIQVHYQNSPLEVINNGHTIQVKFESGSTINLSDQTYELLQVHFHSPSEHKIAGRTYPMEIHLVHRDKLGTLAVVGVLVKEGTKHEVVQKIWDHIPASDEQPMRSLASMHQNPVNQDQINAEQLLPNLNGYFHYKGSLTTPPCSQGVNWYVLRHPVELSQKQIDLFREYYPRNARPVQPINDRSIVSK